MRCSEDILRSVKFQWCELLYVSDSQDTCIYRAQNVIHNWRIKWRSWWNSWHNPRVIFFVVVLGDCERNLMLIIASVIRVSWWILSVVVFVYRKHESSVESRKSQEDEISFFDSNEERCNDSAEAYRNKLFIVRWYRIAIGYRYWRGEFWKFSRTSETPSMLELMFHFDFRLNSYWITNVISSTNAKCVKISSEVWSILFPISVFTVVICTVFFILKTMRWVCCTCLAYVASIDNRTRMLWKCRGNLYRILLKLAPELENEGSDSVR